MKCQIKPMPLWQSIVLFGIPAVVFILITNVMLPYFNNSLELHPALSWFIGGYFIFVPLFILTLILYKAEGHDFNLKNLLNRLRIKPLSKRDWKWTILSGLAILVSTGLIMLFSKLFSEQFGIPQLRTTPSFMEFQTLQGYEKFYLFIWLPMFFFNIVGEEILWRGYILPRQEAKHGKRAWVINSALWFVFHLCFGRDLLIILLPILIIVPFTAYKTKNTLIGIITHGLLNGPMFVLVSLGLI